MHRVRAGVHEAGGGDLAREVPRGDDPLGREALRGAERGVRVERRRDHPRRFELAVVVIAGGPARARRKAQVPAPGAASPERGADPRHTRVVDPERRRQRPLAGDEPPPGRVVGEEHPIPLAGAQRLGDAGAAGALAVAQGGGERTVLVDLQAEARTARGVDPRDDALPPAEARQGGPDGGRHGEAPEGVEGQGGRDPPPGAVVDRLHPRRVEAGEVGVHGLLADARAGGVGSPLMTRTRRAS